MSDCSMNAWGGYDTLMLHIDFEGEEQPWTYPLALNGRRIERVLIGGDLYKRVCSDDSVIACPHCRRAIAMNECISVITCPICGKPVSGE